MTGRDRREGMQAALAAFFAPELRAWRGEMPLAVVFWLYGVVASFVLGTLYASSVLLGQHRLEQALIFFFCVYSVWLPVSIWRSSLRSASPWSVPARWLSLAWGLNAFFLLIFRQLDLIAGYIAG